MARVRKIVLSEADYETLQLHTLGIMSDLAMAIQDATGVKDLRVKTVDGSTIFVESESFADLTCCWKGSAPRWQEAEVALSN